MKSETCNVKEKIHHYMDGDFSDSEIDQLWAELLGRPDDLDYLQTIAALKKMGYKGKFNFDDNSATEHTSGKAKTYKKYLVAASLLILGMAILFQITTSDQAAGLSPIASIEYEIERSADSRTTFDSHLQRAVSLSTAGDVVAAINELDEAANLQLSEKQITDMKMIEGAIYYNAGLFDEAVETFTTISLKDELSAQNVEKSLWYLANSQLHLNKIDEAKSNIEKVIELDGAFSRIATQKLDQF